MKSRASGCSFLLKDQGHAETKAGLQLLMYNFGTHMQFIHAYHPTQNPTPSTVFKMHKN